MYTYLLIVALASQMFCGCTAETVEIQPVSAAQSRPFRNMPKKYGAHKVIDNNFKTQTITEYLASDWEAGTWVTVHLGAEFCVETVEIWYFLDLPKYKSTFTCTNDEIWCHSCEGYCAKKAPLLISVYTEDYTGSPSAPPPDNGCTRGDSVKFHNMHAHILTMYELKVFVRVEE